MDMKRLVLISLLVVAMGVMAFVGCEKPEPIEEPQDNATTLTHKTELKYSGCHSSKRNGSYEPIISTNYENYTLQLVIDNFYVNCGIDSLTVVSEFDAQTIYVNLIEICENQANCICPIDINYSIDNIKQSTYELVINRGNSIIYQEEITCE